MLISTLATVLAVLIVPTALTAALLLITGRRERARERRLARQVIVTDAIDAELGAIVAPVVTRRFGRGWRVEVAVPFEQPAMVGRVVTLAHAAMLRTGERAASLQVVLTAQEPEVQRANARFLRAAGVSPLRVGEREVVAWTGTTMSRANW